MSLVRQIFPIFLFCAIVFAQGSQDGTNKSEQNPPVKVNILNVCAPTSEDERDLKAALARAPKVPSFASDYEISRGVSAVDQGKTARYVRLRRDFKSDSPLATIQYSLSTDPESTVETLVFRGRDVKDLLALSIEDTLSTSASKPAEVVATDTPASRVRVERLGKSTVALARCDKMDQARYDPIFNQASSVLAEYRRVLKLQTMLANDIAWLSSSPSADRGSRQGLKTH